MFKFFEDKNKISLFTDLNNDKNNNLFSHWDNDKNKSLFSFSDKENKSIFNNQNSNKNKSLFDNQDNIFNNQNKSLFDNQNQNQSKSLFNDTNLNSNSNNLFNINNSQKNNLFSSPNNNVLFKNQQNSQTNNLFCNFNKNINNNDLLSLINCSLLVKCHEHPLVFCNPNGRNKYGTGWNCNKCSANYSYEKPSFYCTFCDYDLCINCLGEYSLKEIKLYNDNDSYNFKNIQQSSKGNFQWQIKNPFHSHLLTYIERRNKNYSWICDICSKTYQNQESSFYCSLCDFDICQKCIDINYNINDRSFKTNLFSVPFPINHFCPLRKFLNDKSIDNDKPVIYLYPKKPMDISVQLNIKEGKFTAIYPNFNEKNNTWNVHAKPNGDIILKNKTYPYLYYECESYYQQEMNEGFIVKGEDAIPFLEEKLKILGLNEKESTDFITYWLPILIKNKLSLCSFQTEKFFNYFKLNITPKPDTLIRIFLSIKKIDTPIDIKEQKLEYVERKGFTAIEWGGSKL